MSSNSSLDDDYIVRFELPQGIGATEDVERYALGIWATPLIKGATELCTNSVPAASLPFGWHEMRLQRNGLFLAKQCCALVEQSVWQFITNVFTLTVTTAAIYASFYRFSALHCLSCRFTFNADSHRGLLGELHIKLREQSRTSTHKACAMELMEEPDLTTGNLLLGMVDLDCYEERDLFELFGPPVTDRLQTQSGTMFGAEAPQYIVGNVDFISAASHVFRPDVKLVDFDQCFPTSSPPQKMLSTPYDFLAPEVAAGLGPSPASDVWALGCCILRLRAGDGPFSSPFEIGCPADVMSYIIHTLGGDVPREWQEILWDDKGMPTKDVRKGTPLVEWGDPERSLRDIVYNIWDEPCSCVIETGSSHGVEERAIKVDGAYLSGYNKDWPLVLASLPKIPNHEAALLLDLLTTIFVYDPKKRPTAEELLEHPWFHLDGLEQ
ncbi:hypothetical protein MY4038_008120 [Beauveria bassiana]